LKVKYIEYKNEIQNEREFMIKNGLRNLFLLLCLILLLGCSDLSKQAKRHITYSQDNVPISYTVYGKGDMAVIFVHGWSCDSRYWDMQVPAISKKYQVITVDLAGHGHSGASRTDYTMSAFAHDVKAVVEDQDLDKVILVGHSMGGEVMVFSARLMPEKVLGLIAVDTLMDVEAQYTQEEIDQMLSGFKQDFSSHTQAFVKDMFRKDADKDLMDWVAKDMAAADPKVAISAISEYLQMFVTGQTASIFKGLEIPVRAINADLWPIDYEANRRHMYSFNAVIMPNTGHFLMLENPEEFNQLLLDTIDWILQDD
jgi:pimeloyl-ACP methyl ester carboxylesterase